MPNYVLRVNISFVGVKKEWVRDVCVLYVLSIVWLVRRFTGTPALYIECDVRMCHGSCPVSSDLSLTFAICTCVTICEFWDYNSTLQTRHYADTLQNFAKFEEEKISVRIPLAMCPFPLDWCPVPLDWCPVPLDWCPVLLDWCPIPLDWYPFPLDWCPLPLDWCPLPMDWWPRPLD